MGFRPFLGLVEWRLCEAWPRSDWPALDSFLPFAFESLMQNPLRHLPSVNELLENPQLQKVVDRVNHSVVVNGARKILDDVRGQVRQAADNVTIPTPAELASRVADWVLREEQPRLRPVINATGILLHTGLGRAPLSQEALQSITAIAGGYSSLEVDLESGHRSQRGNAVEKLLCELTGAEAATVVNNNAGATLITLATLAKGREVVVSRGHLIEIGGSYRLPDVMAVSGAILKEVGTTNKTRISDYSSAIGESTGALMKVHPSNFEVVGFTESVGIESLVEVAHQHRLPVIDDIGSGALFDFGKYGLSHEPVVADSIQAGADVALFSGDKLVGGPQCGIIVGKKKYIDKILKNPLMRALRVDKMTLAGLAATLRVYRDVESAEQAIPLLAMLSTSLENLAHRAERLAPQIDAIPGIESATAVACHSMLGGGTVPTQQIESMGIAICPTELSVDKLATRLRKGSPALFGRINNDRLLLDLRTVTPSFDVEIVDLLSTACGTPLSTEE
jgi:L-seryl-tRNA(Ser) seleniumtransferase